MKKINELIFIGSFLLYSNVVLANNEQIKMNCVNMAKNLCGEKCIQPEEPSSDDYPEWWSQAQKNKEWNRRNDLKKQIKIYEKAISSQEDYINYCIKKEEDILKLETVNDMVHRKVIEHENIFYSWNRFRLNELNSNKLTFNTLEEDRDIYNKRYNYYKKNKYNAVRNSLKEFVEESKLEKRLSILEGRHKNVELQNEFLTYLSKDLMNYTAYFDAISKLESFKRIKDMDFNKDKIKLELTSHQKEALTKFMQLIERKTDRSVERFFEDVNLKIVEESE